MSIDPRLAERRREVAEDLAKRNVRRLLRFLAVITVIGAVVWFALSPYMSVTRVRAAGVVASDTHALLAEHNVVPGTPMVLLRAGQIRDAIEADPWVIAAEVKLGWPNDVVVRVTERVPRAWVETAGGWSRRSEDGAPIPSRNTPDNTLGWVRFPTLTPEEAAGSALVIGSIEFLQTLPPDLAVMTALRLESGELWAVVDGYQVRLGRPVEMREKAISLVALLEEDIPKSSVLTLIAPNVPAERPAPNGETSDEPGEDNGEEP